MQAGTATRVSVQAGTATQCTSTQSHINVQADGTYQESLKSKFDLQIKMCLEDATH